MPKAIITVGIPCSGKTTWAKAQCKKDGNWININRDDLRFSLHGCEGWGDYKFNKQREKLVTATQEVIISEAAKLTKNIIISDTNLNPKTLKRWCDYLEGHGYAVDIKEFPITLEEAYRRDALRENGVGQKVIYEMYQKWLAYKNTPVYTPNDNHPKAIIVDLDGTLADMTGLRGPFEWDKVGLDYPREEIIDMVQGYSDRGYLVIVCSGRDGICEYESRKWMDTYSVPYDMFFIRKHGDTRKDTIVKEEIFWDRIAHSYDVKLVIDDRPSVCRMWRNLGLNVAAVADPYKEF